MFLKLSQFLWQNPFFWCLCAFELFECYVCMLLSYLNVLAVICLHTGLFHLSTCSLRMKAFPVCLCHLLFNQVLCTQKMLSTQELCIMSPWVYNPLCGLILPSLCRGLAGSSMSTCSAKVFGLMQLSSVVGALEYFSEG